LWLKNGEVILGHDTGFFLDPVVRLKTYLYAWQPFEGFGVDYSLYRAFIVTLAPHALFGFLTGSLAWAQRLGFIFWFFVMGVSMYVFANYLLPKKKDWPFRLIASTYYVYNFFILQGWFIAERAKFSLYAALPLMLTTLLKTQRREISLTRGTVYFSLTFFFLNGGGSPPLYGFIVLALFIYYFYFFVQAIYSRNFQLFRRLTLMYLLFALGAVLINFYWLYPLFKYYLSAYTTELGSRGGIGGQLEWLIETSKHTSWFNLIRLQGIPSWYENHAYSNWFISSVFAKVISLFMPFIVLLGFFKSRLLRRIDKKNRDILLICTLFLFASLIASAGSHAPLGFIYIFAIKYIPGFAIFRNAFYKFASGLWFSEIILFSYFANYFISNVRYKKYLASALVAAILVFHYPYFSSNIFSLDSYFSTKLNVPNYVYKMSEYVITNTPKESRILLMPPVDPKTGIDAYEWGFYSLDYLAKSAFYRSTISLVNDNSGLVSNFYKAVENGKENEAKEIATLLGISKILWRDDAVYPAGNLNLNEFTKYKNSLDQSQFFHKEIEYGKWVLYDFAPSEPVYAAKVVIATNASPDVVVGNSNYEGGLGIIEIDGYEADWQHLYIRPTCSGCDFNHGVQLSEYLFIPEIRYKPESFMYQVSAYFENRRLKNASSPAEKIDALLVNTSKRVGEMRDFGASQKLTDEFRKNMDLIVSNFTKLPEDRKIFYSTRILEYLSYLEKYYPAASEYKNYFEPWVWDTDSYEEVKMLVEIPQKDSYKLESSNYQNLTIDGKLVEGELVQIDQGVHKLMVTRERPDNLLSETSVGKSLLQEFNYPLDMVRKDQPYLLKFNYKIESKNPVWFVVENGLRFEELKLFSDGNWHEFSHLFSANGPSGFKVFSKENNIEIELELDDMYLHAFTLPELYFYKQPEQANHQNVKIQSKKVSPVEYEFTVDREISNKSLIILDQNYAEGWVLEGASGPHIKVNGFANGWLVDGLKEGEYHLHYQPQGYYNIGIYITLFVIVLSTGYGLYDLYKKRRGI